MRHCHPLVRLTVICCYDTARIDGGKSGVHLLRIFAGGVEEEARGDGHEDLLLVAPRRHEIQLVPVHCLQQLLTHVLRVPSDPSPARMKVMQTVHSVQYA